MDYLRKETDELKAMIYHFPGLGPSYAEAKDNFQKGVEKLHVKSLDDDDDFKSLDDNDDLFEKKRKIKKYKS